MALQCNYWNGIATRGRETYACNLLFQAHCTMKSRKKRRLLSDFLPFTSQVNLVKEIEREYVFRFLPETQDSVILFQNREKIQILIKRLEIRARKYFLSFSPVALCSFMCFIIINHFMMIFDLQLLRISFPYPKK